MKRKKLAGDTGIRPASGPDWDPVGQILQSRAGFPPAVISNAIQSLTDENDILLDPFSAYGAAAVEALRLNRRAVLIELNPVTAFFAEVILRPASLPRLQWGLQDVRDGCREELSALYSTGCPKCGKQGFVERVDSINGKAVRIEYSCACSPKRLAKKPDAADRRADERIAGMEIPFRHPPSRPLSPKYPLRYPTDYLNRRTIAALSTILHAIDNLAESSARDALKAAFAAALEFCHPAVPASEKTRGRERRSMRTEVNPWTVFERCAWQLYGVKKETNRTLKNAAVGRSMAELASGRANVVILGRASADATADEIPGGSVEGMATAIPGDPAGRGIGLTAIQAAWLGKELDYARDIVVDCVHGGSRQERHERILAALRAARRAVKTGGAVRIYYPERKETDLHGLLSVLEKSGLDADQIRYRPEPKARGSRGGYLLDARISKQEGAVRARIPEEVLRKKLAAAARMRFHLHGANATAENILHAFYQKLDAAEISSISKYSAEDFLTKSVESFARYRGGKFTFLKGKSRPAGKRIAAKLVRQAVLDAELLAADDGELNRPVWESAIRRFSRDDLTLEDAAFIRQNLRPAEIVRYRRKHAADLLRGWGSALGYAVRPSKNADGGILWKTSAGRIISFTLSHRDISVASRPKDGAAKWGSLSYSDLERILSDWYPRHPDRKNGLAEFVKAPDDLHLILKDGPQEDNPPAKDMRLKVMQNRKICDRHFLMTAELPKDAELKFAPGQFFHLLCDPGTDKGRSYPLTLRRPFSIHRAWYPGFHPAALTGADDLPEELRSALVRHPARIDFLYRVVGEGTELLSRVRKGAVLHAIGPCGNGFTIGEERTAVIVAGGIGIAPMAALAEQLRFSGKEVLLYIGAVAKDMLSLAVTRGEPADDDRGLLEAIESEFSEIGARVLTVCTDDGSAGEKGFVTDMLEQGIRGGCIPRESVCLYACGPEGMLRAVAQIAARQGLDCQVSLEERMACGIGACYSCTATVVKPDGTTQKKRVCREGPVFHAREIQWKD